MERNLVIASKIAYEAVLSLVGMCPQDIVIKIHNNIWARLFIMALLLITKDWKQLQWPLEGTDWLNYDNQYIHKMECFVAGK